MRAVLNQKGGQCRTCGKVHQFWTKDCKLVAFPDEIDLTGQVMYEIDPEYPLEEMVPYHKVIREGVEGVPLLGFSDDRIDLTTKEPLTKGN